MYPNLRAEIARKGFTLGAVAKKMNMPYTTFTQKVSGSHPFYVEEAKKLKKILNVDIPLEILFAEVG